MNWKWTLIESDATETVVTEPVGWDGISCNFSRNMVHHGVFTNISTDSFEWVGTAYDLLYAEYNLNGANGQMQIKIEYECAAGDGYTVYFVGNFDFNTLERQCLDYCFIKCSVTATKCTDVFLSRMGQDVDILATTNFDGQAISPMSYTTLNIDGQDVLLQNKANNIDSETFNETATDLSGLTGSRFYDIPVFLPLNPLAEMGNDTSGSPAWNVNNVSPVIVAKNGALDNISFPLPDGESDFENYFQFMYLYEPGNNDCVNDLSIEWAAKGTFEITPNYNGTATITLRAYKRNPITNGDLDDLGSIAIATTATLTNGVTLSVPFDESFTGTTPQPLANSYIVFAWHIDIVKSSASGTDTTAFVVAYDTTTNFYMYADSSCSATVARSVPLSDLLEFLPTAYMSTDCPVMAIEAELRDCLDRYSITKGSFIRNVTEPSVPKLFTSYEWLFEQCRKMFNIGWGFTNNETDLFIARIEHFYKSNIVADVGLLNMATFTTAKDLIYGTITVGYNKWEAEEYNGLDETNTERQYRRNIDSNPAELDLMADIISAGYTIEVTRRKDQVRTGTSDWRYDDDLFIINSETIGGFLYAIRGIDNGAANIYSPATRMNYVLTPVRNLLRWFKSLCAASPTVANEQQLFTSGTGNYIATGEMTATCQIENQPITENATISTAIIGDVYYETPIWKTIYATFEAPLSMAKFEDIKLDPYAAIRFRCSDDIYTGNIVELSHDPNKGIANFKLLLRR